MFSVAPNIVFAPNMTQNAERKHRTQDANTANFRSWILQANRQSKFTQMKSNQNKISRVSENIEYSITIT